MAKPNQNALWEDNDSSYSEADDMSRSACLDMSAAV